MMGPIPMFMGEKDPCAGVPNFSSVGTPSVTANGSCPLTSLTLSTSITITGSLPAGAKIQYRQSWSTSSGTVPSGGWSDVSGWSGTTDTHTYQPNDSVRYSGTTLIGTYYYKVEFRIVGTDGTTVCDSETYKSLTVTSVYSCAE